MRRAWAPAGGRAHRRCAGAWHRGRPDRCGAQPECGTTRMGHFQDCCGIPGPLKACQGKLKASGRETAAPALKGRAMRVQPSFHRCPCASPVSWRGRRNAMSVRPDHHADRPFGHWPSRPPSRPRAPSRAALTPIAPIAGLLKPSRPQPSAFKGEYATTLAPQRARALRPDAGDEDVRQRRIWRPRAPMCGGVRFSDHPGRLGSPMASPAEPGVDPMRIGRLLADRGPWEGALSGLGRLWPPPRQRPAAGPRTPLPCQHVTDVTTPNGCPSRAEIIPLIRGSGLFLRRGRASPSFFDAVP